LPHDSRTTSSEQHDSSIFCCQHAPAWCRAEDWDYLSLKDGSRPNWFWTGPHPSQEGSAGIVNGRITSLPLPNVASASKDAVLEYFDNSWLISEIIFSGSHRSCTHILEHSPSQVYGVDESLMRNALNCHSQPPSSHFQHRHSVMARAVIGTMRVERCNFCAQIYHKPIHSLQRAKKESTTRAYIFGCRRCKFASSCHTR
jgi:hypothetical protein